MIDKKSVENSLGVAEKLASAGVTLTTVDNTALQHTMADMLLPPPEGSVTDVDVLAEHTRKAGQTDEHDASMGIIADHAARSVLNTHRLVVDVINPHVRKVVDQIQETLSRDSDDGTGHQNVQYRHIHQSMDLDTLKSAVLNIAKMDLFDIPPAHLGEYSVDEIRDLVKFTGANGFDDYIGNYLATNPRDVHVINQVLAGSRNPSLDMGQPVLVILVLLTQALAHTDNIKEGISVPLSTYKARMFWLSTSAARLLKGEYDKWDNIERSRLIYATDSGSNELHLIQSTMAELSRFGVTVEHLIGNDILDRRYSFVDFATEDNGSVLAETMAAYNKDLSIKNTNRETLMTERLLRVALTTIRDDAISNGDDPECLRRLGDTKTTLVARASAACEAVFKTGKKIQGDDLDEFVAGVLISIYYAHTDALIYMDALADFSKQYPDMNVVDLAKLARANLVVNWVYAQVAIAQ